MASLFLLRTTLSDGLPSGCEPDILNSEEGEEDWQKPTTFINPNDLIGCGNDYACVYWYFVNLHNAGARIQEWG